VVPKIPLPISILHVVVTVLPFGNSYGEPDPMIEPDSDPVPLSEPDPVSEPDVSEFSGLLKASRFERVKVEVAPILDGVYPPTI
jgi:hypothetical protein